MRDKLFGWVRRPSKFVVDLSISRIRELIERQGFALVVIRTEETEALRIFVLGVESGRLTGHDEQHMVRPSIGQHVWYLNEVQLLQIIEPGQIPLLNETFSGPLKAKIHQLANSLHYDERYCIYQARTGERVWVTGGFHNTDWGFSATHYVEDGESKHAAFINYNLGPFYDGTFFMDGDVEPVPNFVYYDWMGQRVRNTTYLLPKQAHARASAIEKLEAALAAQRMAVRDLELSLNLLKRAHADVHE